MAYPKKRIGPGFIDMTGNRYGRLVVIGLVPRNTKAVLWHCRCDCGVNKICDGHDLRRNSIQSCGCYRIEAIGLAKRKHGMSLSSLYALWSLMRGRCNNSTLAAYRNYGGRGIKVCERWSEFQNFADDMGDRPAGTSLDRINNNGNYEPDNCRWATQKTQNNNTRRNVLVTLNGVTRNTSQWAEVLGVPASRIRYRLNAGWPPDKACAT